MSRAGSHAGVTRRIDVVVPGDTNHHGTLFSGTALARLVAPDEHHHPIAIASEA